MINSLLLLMWHQEVWRANETKNRAALKDKQQVHHFFLKVHLWVNENYFASATCDPWRNDVSSKSSEKVRLIGEIGIRSHKQILAERLIIKRTERGGIWIEPSLATPCRRYHSICYPLASYMRVAICYFQERAAFLEGLRSSWHNRWHLSFRDDCGKHLLSHASRTFYQRHDKAFCTRKKHWCFVLSKVTKKNNESA